MARPNFIVIGVNKAGTSTLYRHLRAHPEIGASDRKELRYFTPLRWGEPIESMASYEANYIGIEDLPVRIDVSPSYLHGGDVLASAIEAELPDARIGVILREPSARCVSYFRFQVLTGSVAPDASFSDYLDRCASLSQSELASKAEHPYWGLWGGCYAHFLEPWLERFGDDLGVFFFDDLHRDSARFAGDVVRWLGLDPAPVLGAGNYVENRSFSPRSPALNQAARRINHTFESLWRRHPELKAKLRHAYHRLNEQDDGFVITGRDQALMEEYFAPWNQRLGEMLFDSRPELALPSWLVKDWTTTT